MIRDMETIENRMYDVTFVGTGYGYFVISWTPRDKTTPGSPLRYNTRSESGPHTSRESAQAWIDAETVARRKATS